MGVFARGETVYSVYIPMSDLGGPDWPMQYAVVGGTPTGNGLLSPPIAARRVPALGSHAAISANSPIFITGIIDDKGKVQNLHSLQNQDGRSQAAMIALQLWEFLPAKLDGIAVTTKVVIGVTVLPTAPEEEPSVR
jgi:hypothetical protein